MKEKKTVDIRYELRRTAMTVVGVLMCSFSIAVFMHSAFGLDPFQCLSQGVYTVFSEKISFGNYYIIWSLLLLIADFFLDRSQIGVATFAHLFLTGYVVDASKALLEGWFPAPTLALRVGMLLVGIVVVCIGAGFYFESAQGVSVYDAVANGLTNRGLTLGGKKVPFKFIRIATDVICVAAGMAFGLMPGIGTVIAAFFMGPLIDWCKKHLAAPLLGKQPPAVSS